MTNKLCMTTPRSLYFSVLFFLSSLVVPNFCVAGQPVVLASIKPLALIAREVVGTRMQVQTLLPNTASPHDYPLKMSDHRRLQKAEVILWVGPELESFLAKPLGNMPEQKILTSFDLPGINWPALAEGHHQDDGHHHGAKDPHVWLDPRNAALIAQALAVRLAQLHPEYAAEFAANSAAFARATEVVDRQLLAKLEPISARGFGVAHEGYAHFIARYNLNQLAFIALTPERRPGAKHLQEVRQLLAQGGVCLFTEPFNQAEAFTAMATELNLKMGVLDPIGNAQVSSYSQLLNNLGEAFLACLAQGGIEGK
jgi:zinc transport system substrate-binding protein